MRFTPIVLLAALVVVPGCSESKPQDPLFPDLDLPVLGVAGKESRAVPEPRAILNLFADGKMTLNGADLAPTDLYKVIGPLAKAHANDAIDGQPVVSELALVIRADRTVPLSSVERVLRTTVFRLGWIRRIFFAVIHEGDDVEATFALVRNVPTPGHRDLRRPPGKLLRVTSRHVDPAEPDDLRSVLDRTDEKRPLLIEPDGDVSIGYFLRLLSVLSRTGQEDIHIAGTFASPGSGGGTGMRLDAQSIPAGVAHLPPVPRTADVVGIHLAGSYSIREFGDALVKDRLLVAVLDAGGRREDLEALRPKLTALAERQRENGSYEHSVRSTALAALAFLGGGNTHRAGEHQKALKAGLVWLKRMQREDGRFSTDAAEHAIGAFAYARAYGQTESPLLKRCAQKALDALGDTEGPWATLARREGAMAKLRARSDPIDAEAALTAALYLLPVGDPTAAILKLQARWLLPGKLQLR